MLLLGPPQCCFGKVHGVVVYRHFPSCSLLSPLCVWVCVRERKGGFGIEDFVRVQIAEWRMRERERGRVLKEAWWLWFDVGTVGTIWWSKIWQRERKKKKILSATILVFFSIFFNIKYSIIREKQRHMFLFSFWITLYIFQQNLKIPRHTRKTYWFKLRAKRVTTSKKYITFFLFRKYITISDEGSTMITYFLLNT